MDRCIAAVDAAASSIKFTLYEADVPDAVRYRGRIAQIGSRPRLQVWTGDGREVAELSWREEAFDHRAASREVLRTAGDLIRGAPVIAIGHRVLNGGLRSGPVRVQSEILEDLAALALLTPWRKPHDLDALEAIAEAAPHIPQVACFDTALHRSQRGLARMLARPPEIMAALGACYSLHGLAYESVLARLEEVAPAMAGQRIVIVHLGEEVSLCAAQKGRSVQTTLGFTPPAPPTLFVRRVAYEIGALRTALGGMDGLVFTGVVGEKNPVLRAAIATGCGRPAIELDPGRNARGIGEISTPTSPLPAWVIPAQVDLTVARHTRAVLGLGFAA